MKAAILEETNKPLVVADIELPTDLAFGQVHVRIHYSGICGSQLNEIQGTKGPDRHLPHLLGHEGSGTVLRTGRGVTRVQNGDHVVLHWRQASGVQSETPKYRWGSRIVNAGWVTTFNEEAIVSENRLTVIPPDFDLRLAPLFGCAVTTGFGVVNNDAHLKIGQSIVIFGVGGIGLNIAQAAEMVSANPIVGVDLHESKLSMGLAWGLTHGVNATPPNDVGGDLRKILGKHGADVVIDTTGNPRVIELAYELTHPDGKTILVGVPGLDQRIQIHTLPLHFKQVLKGSHGGGAIPDKDIPRLIGLMHRGKMRLEGLVTNEFPLDRINDAIDLLRRGTAGRILVNMQSHL